MSEWPATTLGDVAELFVGHAFNSGTFTDETQDVRLLRGINVGVGAINWSSTKYWPRKLAGGLGDLHLKIHDVVVAMDRPWIDAGLKVASIRTEDLPSLLVQRVARLRASPQLHQGYLRATVGSDHFAAYLRSLAGGTAVPHVSASDIQNFSFLLPPLTIQRRIAAVLSAFDELIEINQRRIGLLEALARSLYREWFVHLRFPGHEEVEFVDSELGPIPEEWEVRAVREIAKLQRRAVRPAMEAEAAFEHFSIPGFDRSGLPEFELGGTIRSGKQAIDAECVLLSKINPRIKRVWFAVPSTRRGVASTEFLVWAGVKASNAWLWATFSDDEFHRWLSGVSGGTSTSHQRVNSRDVEAHALSVAPPELRGAFDKLATPALRQATALRQHSRTLAATRDLLLPRLVTGRLDISDIDLGGLLTADAA